LYKFPLLFFLTSVLISFNLILYKFSLTFIFTNLVAYRFLQCVLFSFMRGKFLVDKSLFVPKITQTERENIKKKKQATTITPGKSSSFDYFSPDKPLVENNMANQGGN